MQTLQIGNSWWNIIEQDGKVVYRDGPYTSLETAKGVQRIHQA